MMERRRRRRRREYSHTEIEMHAAAAAAKKRKERFPPFFRIAFSIYTFRQCMYTIVWLPAATA